MSDLKITEEFKESFIDMLEVVPNITAVCRIMGISKSCIHDARKKDTIFDKRVLDAIDGGYDMIEEEARRRAVEGVLEPVYFKGEEVGNVRKYSDQLLMFLLKAYRKKFNPGAKIDFGDKTVTMTFNLGGEG